MESLWTRLSETLEWKLPTLEDIPPRDLGEFTELEDLSLRAELATVAEAGAYLRSGVGTCFSTGAGLVTVAEARARRRSMSLVGPGHGGEGPLTYPPAPFHPSAVVPPGPLDPGIFSDVLVSLPGQLIPPPIERGRGHPWEQNLLRICKI